MVAFFVILTFVGFILADAVVQWVEVKREERKGAIWKAPLAPALAFEGVSVPRGIFVDSGHTWVGLDPSGTARVGMDSFVQRVMGRIDRIELPREGQKVRRGEELFAVRQGDRRAVFAAPLEGVVGAVNGSLALRPDAIEAEPYQKGWICTLNPMNLAGDLRQLSIAEDARDWLKREMRRFQDFITRRPIEHSEMGELMPDGGQITQGILESMDEETWHLFKMEFLRDIPSEKTHK